ncbi:Quinolinate synthase [Thermodesulfobium narugense DSM 14796]|uniref:quinolinate synthase n=1 Tax=Thermodesulfobium narugense DSM 14796 TaxID=747365 RepID=M1E9I1_9BACT|nr:quinolinate synthase [Thermodesulfobium narugense]AEE15319.1 Quinolinate synthase [Thermodesulfobium narugense DSM 14796]
MQENISANSLAKKFYDLFNRYAEDLYPGRYTHEKCKDLANIYFEIKDLKQKKDSLILSHNYLYPEFHEISDNIGDSLGLSLFVKEKKCKRVDFQGVFFMGSTSKIIVGNEKRLFVPDKPENLGCSLVDSIDTTYIKNWKEKYDGVVISYVNSDIYTKSLSDYICTSRNADKVIINAIKKFKGKKVLILPDKNLGKVMKARAIDSLKEEGTDVDPNIIEVYEQEKAYCHVHEKISLDYILSLIDKYKESDLLIHPECSCSFKLYEMTKKDKELKKKLFIVSTEQMVSSAKSSSAKSFIVGTEKGMVYRLRKEVPEKEFLPIDFAQCEYMKENTLEKLLESLKSDRYEIFISDTEEVEFREDGIYLPRKVAEKARVAIERMLEIK